jgi:hypothetical protein
MKRIEFRPLLRSTAIALAITAMPPAFADAGGTFTVTSEQYPNGIAFPSVARDAAGDFAVAWFSFSSGYMRWFSADGTPKGQDLKIADGILSYPVVAMDRNGNSVSVWQNNVATGDLVAQRYNADGTANGALITIATHMTTTLPLVAMNANGEFVIAWGQTEGYPVSFPKPSGFLAMVGSEIYARAFNADGSARTDATLVDNVPLKLAYIKPDYYHSFGNADELHSLAIDDNGNFVLSMGEYREPKLKQYREQLAYMRFDADGNNLGTTTVGTSGTDIAIESHIGLAANDSFVLEQFSPSGGLRAGLYAADGTHTGDVGPIASSAGTINKAQVKVMPSGDFVMAWSAKSGTMVSNQAAYFHADGSANGAVTTISSSAQDYPDLATALDANGNLVSVWSSVPGSTQPAGTEILGHLTSAP